MTKQLFHVTDARGLVGISRDGAILPGSETGRRTWRNPGENGDKGRKVYLADREQADKIAGWIQDHKGGSLYILEVDADSSKLEPDEDSGKDTWQESLSTPGIGSCAHRGRVPNWRVARRVDYNLSRKDNCALAALVIEGRVSLEEGDEIHAELIRGGELYEQSKYGVLN
jgi:hypothetical protein